jgi:hypothetical protein
VVDTKLEAWREVGGEKEMIAERLVKLEIRFNLLLNSLDSGNLEEGRKILDDLIISGRVDRKNSNEALPDLFSEAQTVETTLARLDSFQQQINVLKEAVLKLELESFSASQNPMTEDDKIAGRHAYLQEVG